MAKTWGSKLCDYGCGEIANYILKNGKFLSPEYIKKKILEREK